VEIGEDRIAQDRIAEEARRDRLQVPVVLLAHGMRRLFEDEKFVFERAVRLETEATGALDDAAQEAARTQGLRRRREFGEKEQGLRLEGDFAAALRHDACRRVGIGGVPPRIRQIVDELVIRIPAQHDVAKAETALERRKELVARYVLAAHHPVDIDEPQLDMAEAARLDDTARIGRAFYITCLHSSPPSPQRRPDRTIKYRSKERETWRWRPGTVK